MAARCRLAALLLGSPVWDCQSHAIVVRDMAVPSTAGRSCVESSCPEALQIWVTTKDLTDGDLR